MKAMVARKGLLIPKKFLKGVREVKIRKDDNCITIIPVSADDPILQLGKHPVECNIRDAAEKHDDYIYGDHE